MSKNVRTYLPSEGKPSGHMSESRPQTGVSGRQKMFISGQDLLDTKTKGFWPKSGWEGL